MRFSNESGLIFPVFPTLSFVMAKKDQIAILRPLFEKTVKVRPLLIPNIPPLHIKSELIFRFSQSWTLKWQFGLYGNYKA